ncbi:MAG TPA: N-acetylmuramoyl-L-alanine amidase [Dehalococcoidia bacterium]|nr:N-acetylmuramoyl-L-alanine amidase [Dehalococcoidia bacterium]
MPPGTRGLPGNAPVLNEPGPVAGEGTSLRAEDIAQPADDAPPAETITADVDGAAISAIAAPSPERLDRAYTIILDAGHGGSDTGAIANRIVERESNLDFARRVEEILVAQGHRVVQTRVDGGRSVLYPDEETIPQIAESRIDLQARVDLANQEGGDVFVSIHSNLSSTNSFERGVEVWFDPNRPHSEANFRLSVNLLTQVIAELFEFGYPVFNRQIHSDECHSVEPGLNICLPLFVLGPPATLDRQRVVAAGIDPDRFAFAEGEDVLMTRATEMPAALVELLVLSNPGDSAILRSDAARQAIARGIARAIVEFLDNEESRVEETDSTDLGLPIDSDEVAQVD